MIKCLHLSDFHIGKNSYEQLKLFNYLLTHIDEKCNDSFIPDYVFITGDITNQAKESEFKSFFDEFYLPLYVQLTTIKPDVEFFIVPGNHDLDRKLVEDIPRESRLDASSIFFQADADGLNKRLNYEIRSLENFEKFIFEISSHKSFISSKEGSFAHIFNKKDCKIGIAGINTAWLSRDNKDKEKLSPGIDLTEVALKAISDCDIKILLGHHPLSWIYPQHKKRLLNSFAESNILYFHGHQHIAETTENVIAQNGFIEVQCGAAYHVKDTDSFLKNGFSWVEIDSKTSTIKLQPMKWSFEFKRFILDNDSLHPDMKLDNDWWQYALPQKQITSVVKTYSLPKECKEINTNFFETRTIKSDNNLFLQYIDGSLPEWDQNFLKHIPEREIVQDGFDFLLKCSTLNHSSMLLIRGAAGEGKTTALRQIALKAYEKFEYNIVLFEDKIDLIPIINYCRSNNKPNIFIFDNASVMAKNITIFLDLIKDEDIIVHILCASRDGDWNIAINELQTFNQYCSYKELVLSSLSHEESKHIIDFWTQYGKDGLKELYHETRDDAITKLFDACQNSISSEGSFLGGMLSVRYSDGLKNHVENLLYSLETKCINNSSKNLLDAFVAIAIMHTEDLLFLSLPVLSEYIYNDPRSNIKSNILYPLGKEAAAVRSGNFLYTRHKTIATTAIEILEETFKYDIDLVFSELASCALKARSKGVHIPDLNKWDYTLPNHFINTNSTLSVDIASRLLQEQPSNKDLLTSFAKICRHINDPKIAQQAYLEFVEIPKNDFVFYFEWAQVVKELDQIPFACWLILSAISDWGNDYLIRVDNITSAFLELNQLFESLLITYRKDEYNNASIICRDILNKLENHQKIIIKENMTNLDKAIKLVWNSFSKEGIIDKIPTISQLSYLKLSESLD